MADAPRSEQRITTADGTVIEGLDVRQLDIPALRLFRSAETRDARGSVASVYNRAQFSSLGITDDFVQENHCATALRYTVRGFHFQSPPHGQSKLIRVVKGRILDVNVDLRRGSPTYGRHAMAELSAGGWDQIYVPIGFAHCYATLEDESETIFKLGSAYAPKYASGLAWNDPALGIDWPFPADQAIVLPRDLDRPSLAEIGAPFEYDGQG
ncbi:MAG: dTDP-4-dehydrorhamnose 3,5-epimerase [Alphaproteobacteria bacterium]